MCLMCLICIWHGVVNLLPETVRQVADTGAAICLAILYGGYQIGFVVKTVYSVSVVPKFVLTSGPTICATDNSN